MNPCRHLTAFTWFGIVAPACSISVDLWRPLIAGAAVVPMQMRLVLPAP